MIYSKRFYMKVTKHSNGVDISLSGEEVAIAITAYLHAHQVYIHAPATVTVNDEPCRKGNVWIDPCGFVTFKGRKYGR